MKTIKIRMQTIFILSFSLLLFSRIAVLTGNYYVPIDPVMIEIIYILNTLILLYLNNKGKFFVNLKSLKNNIVSILLLIHVLLFGIVFVNPLMKDTISSQFKSQIVFDIIILVTTIAINNFNALDKFIEISYYTLGIFLFIQFITHLGDIKINNIAHVMSVEERVRSNFGFGHYNALGAACLCMIILTIYLKEKKRLINILILGMAIIMLLCSASRNALTGFCVFIIAYIIQRLNRSDVNPKIRFISKLILLMMIILLIPFAMELDYNQLLKISQRSLIFYVAFPLYINSGRIFTGLGYASNIAYGSNMTPYTTYWLDNSYMYYLITTGVIGFAIILIAVLILGKRIVKNRFLDKGDIICSLYFVYLYTALFEVIIFESGTLLNCIYLPIFISFAMERNKYKLGK